MENIMSIEHGKRIMHLHNTISKKFTSSIHRLSKSREKGEENKMTTTKSTYPNTYFFSVYLSVVRHLNAASLPPELLLVLHTNVMRKWSEQHYTDILEIWRRKEIEKGSQNNNNIKYKNKLFLFLRSPSRFSSRLMPLIFSVTVYLTKLLLLCSWCRCDLTQSRKKNWIGATSKMIFLCKFTFSHTHTNTINRMVNAFFYCSIQFHNLFRFYCTLSDLMHATWIL